MSRQLPDRRFKDSGRFVIIDLRRRRNYNVNISLIKTTRGAQSTNSLFNLFGYTSVETMKITILFSLVFAVAEAQPRFFPYLNATTALKASKAALPVGGTEENTAPFDMPAGYTYRKIIDRKTLNATGTFPPGFGAWDMITYAAPENTVSGLYPDAEKFIFIPFETSNGGLLRYNTVDGSTLILAQGNLSFPRNFNPSTFDVTKDNFQSVDPSTYTPFNTVLFAEETTGGRIFEVQFPFAATQAAASVRWLSKIPATAHEGLRFDKEQTLYFVDESNTGCLYKYVPTVKGNLANGQTFVLRVTSYIGDVTQNWDSFLLSPRVGAAVWVPITDVNGTKTTNADPFQFNSAIGSGARAAADEVFGTPYGRPEDMAISTDKNGREVVYFTATSENAVYGIVLLSKTTAEVKILCDRNTINIATGLPVGGNFTSPDNLAVDFEGTIYVVEDQDPPNADIWQAVDADNDGVAEYVARWLGMGVTGAEPTGLMFSPNNLNTAIVAIQHPSSTNDAIFEIKLGSAPPAQNIPILTSLTALKASKAALPVGGTDENTAPFDMPAGYTYRKIIDRKTLNATGTFPPGFGAWDMVTYAAPENTVPGLYPDAEKFVFIPFETDEGGILRYNTVDGSTLILARGNKTVGRNYNPSAFDVTKDNFVAVDPATYTPFNTLLFAEETYNGRIFEVQFPLAPTQAAASVRWLSKIPSTAHEGIRFDKEQTLYFVDESNTGCLYKYVPTVKGNLANGQTFVLRVSAYAGNVTQNWDFLPSSPRVGAAVWVPITDVNGTKTTVADPFQYDPNFLNTGGRAAADEVLGTPYGRPEDMAIKTDNNGREVVYFTATSENAVYSVVLLSKTTAEVKVFCNRNTIDIATGLPVGSSLTSPDNLAIDADGKVYVVEDQPPAVADIWQAVDLDNDSVAEYLARWLGMGVTGAEPTGLFFSPNNLKRAIVAIQHPDSGNDALFELNFNTAPVPVPVPPPVPVPVTVPVPVPVPVTVPVPVPVPVTPSTKSPTKRPTKRPTKKPTKAPTAAPSTAAPTLAPVRCGFLKRLFNIGGC